MGSGALYQYQLKFLYNRGSREYNTNIAILCTVQKPVDLCSNIVESKRVVNLQIYTGCAGPK